MNMNDILANAINNAVEDKVQPVLSTPIEPSTGQGVRHDTSPPNPPEPPTATEISIKGLDEKAVLISVKRNMY